MSKSRRRKEAKKIKSLPPDSANRVLSKKLDSSAEESYEQFIQMMLKSAHKDVEEYPVLLNELLSILKEKTPADIISTFAFYGARAAIDSRGKIQPLAQEIQQHHIELLQGIILTLPVAEWGYDPFITESMQAVYDSVPKLADTIFKRRLLTNAEEADENQRAIMSLQEKIRLHTQAIRNWGYFSEVKKICREIYVPLDRNLETAFGYTFSDILDVAEALLGVIEERGNNHIDALRRILSAPSSKKMIENYFRVMPDLDGTPLDLIDFFPKGTSREEITGILISHMDLRHADNMSVTAAKIAEITGKDEIRVGHILRILSIKPGELADQKIEHLFLSNPVWTRPGIFLDTHYLFPIPQAIFSHINEIMWNIATSAKIEKNLSDRRSIYLEDKAEAMLQSALPTAKITKNAKWMICAQQFETDIIAVVDKTIILAEAKSHRLTPQGLRGAPDRLKRHLNDIVIAPSVQSERLAKQIIAARTGDVQALKITKSIGIDAKQVDQIVRISLTLDDLSVLSSSEEELSKSGIMPEGHKLAPALHIADLCCIADILNEEIPFLHYFSERFHFQKHFHVFGDELDFLGLYLSTGFNLGADQKNLPRLMLTGMSDIIDRYYDARDAGIILKKPSPEIHRTYKGIIDKLARDKPFGWSTMGIFVLSSASPEEQPKVERGLNRLRHSVTRRNTKLDRERFMQIVPPLNRKATVGFYIHQRSDTYSRRECMEYFAAEALRRVV
ncbi:hypothetical protein, partial [Acetobacter malorum]